MPVIHSASSYSLVEALLNPYISIFISFCYWISSYSASTSLINGSKDKSVLSLTIPLN
nr:MAG TPA: hypothetical protein [Caudoviricetes sp.]